MKPTRRFATALALLALGTGAAVSTHASGQAAPQDDPFEKLKTYDFQSRAPVEAIRLMIDQSLADKAATSQIEQKLDAVLNDPAATFAGKQEAARFLWVIGSGQSVPTLAKMLRDDKLSDVARYALERNSDPAAARALRDAVANTQDKTRLGVINSLGNRGDAEAVAVLKPLVASSDAPVAEAATTALGKIGTSAALDVLKGLPSTSAQAGRAMLRTAEQLAGGGKKADAQRLYETLAGTSRPAVIRAGAMRGLAAMQSPRAVPVALSALKGSDTYLQQVSAQVLGASDDPKAAAQITSAWDSVPPPAQIVLMTGLADRHETSAAPLALKASESQDGALRQAGIAALGRIGGVGAVPRLVDIAAHGQGNDRSLARETLSGMAGADVEQSLLQMAQQGPADTRTILIAVLADRPTPAVMTLLLGAARGSDARSATEALRGLGRVGGAGEYPELVKLAVALKDEGVRDTARDAIIAVGQRMDDPNRATDPLLATYTQTTPANKALLLPILANFGSDRALTELTGATASTNADVRQAAITSLAETWGDTRPLPTLLNIASTDGDKSLRVQALRGYLRLVQQDERMSGEEKAGRIAQALQAAQRPEEKRQSLNLLREIRIPQAVQISAKYLNDPQVGGDATSTILYLAAPQKRNNRDLAAVKGPDTTLALNKIIETTKDPNQRAQAEKLR